MVGGARAQQVEDQPTQDEPQREMGRRGTGPGPSGRRAISTEPTPAVDTEPIIIDRWTMAEDAPSTPALRLKSPELGEVWQLTPRVLTGPEPKEPGDIGALAAMGVHTVICIDAAPPAAWMAAARGLKVFHAPIRHGQTDTGEFLELFRALKFFSGPYYVFAGPGEEQRALHAGIITAVFDENLDGRRMEHLYKDTGVPGKALPWWLDAKGILTQVTYRQVNALPGEAPIAVEPEPLRVWMQRAGASFDVLREASEMNWKTPPHALKYTTLEFEAGAIAGGFERWSAINPGAEQSFRGELLQAASHARALEKSLADKDLTAARGAWLSLARSCQQCHESRRDQP